MAPVRSPGDLRRLYATRSLRAFGAGVLSVALALDLAGAYGLLLAGLLLGLATAAAAAWSVAVERIEGAIGRRRSFVLVSVGLAVGGLLLFLGVGSPLLVLAAVALGGILAGASDIGPLPALEQAALASVATDRTRTLAFGRYNLLGYLGAALGSVAAAPLTGIGSAPLGASHDLALLIYAVLGVALVPTYLGLSTDADRLPRREPRASLSTRSRSRVLALSGLFSVDAFGGGLVANFLVTLWLRERFDAPAATIGLVLALSMVGAAMSLLLAEPLARRFGLVRTMVFTHLPSSALLILFAVAPTLAIAGALWVGRSLLSQMDVPTRQSLVQALVAPDERTAAAGYTTAARSTSAAGGPVTGAFLGLGGPWIGAPFLIAGAAKIAYDVSLYAGFRRVRIPEEGGGIAPVPPD